MLRPSALASRPQPGCCTSGRPAAAASAGVPHGWQARQPPAGRAAVGSASAGGPHGWQARQPPAGRAVASASSVEQAEISWEDAYALEKREAAAREERLRLEQLEREAEKGRRRAALRSSWRAREAGAAADHDYLYALGKKSQQNTNVDTGQNIDNLESHFLGNSSFGLGMKSDIADGSLRNFEFSSFNNIVGDYYIAPSFLDKVTMHVAKNYLAELGLIDHKTKVPLILGIWGAKGMGKSFQVELCLKKLGAEAVVMSASELEHEWAGTPGKLIRERYKKAGELSRTHGKVSVLMINDIDAGLGHFENTQCTVNNQIVIGTLMNLCDNPNSVSLGEAWREGERVRRTPIIVTGNDFTKMFAPLIRDGRMDKYYWNPTRDDLVNILHCMYEDDGLTMDDMDRLVSTFPQQPLDFYGALRSSMYDGQIREWIESDILGGESLSHENANMAALSARLLKRDDLPKFEPVQLTLQDLVREGQRLEQEQQHVLNNKLSKEYLKDTGPVVGGLIGFRG